MADLILPNRSILKPLPGTPLDIHHPLSDGLVGSWLMNENAGDIVHDLSGHKSHGTFQGTPTWQASTNGPALYFSGGTDAVNGVPQVTGYPFSVSFWMSTTASSTWKCLFWIGNSARGDQWYVVYFRDVAGHLTIAARNPGEKYATSPNAVDDGKWHHVVAVFASATDRRLYVDGHLDASSTSSIPFATSTNKWTLGYMGDSSPGGGYIGLLGQTILYDRALVPAEIASLYRDSYQMFEQEQILISTGAPPVAGAVGRLVDGGLVNSGLVYGRLTG